MDSFGPMLTLSTWNIRPLKKLGHWTVIYNSKPDNTLNCFQKSYLVFWKAQWDTSLPGVWVSIIFNHALLMVQFTWHLILTVDANVLFGFPMLPSFLSCFACYTHDSTCSPFQGRVTMLVLSLLDFAPERVSFCQTDCFHSYYSWHLWQVLQDRTFKIH